ncbi:hypothetical protein VTN02DRAFT_4571 [Thermoascus thermophilus]
MPPPSSASSTSTAPGATFPPRTSRGCLVWPSDSSPPRARRRPRARSRRITAAGPGCTPRHWIQSTNGWAISKRR